MLKTDNSLNARNTGCTVLLTRISKFERLWHPCRCTWKGNLWYYWSL